MADLATLGETLFGERWRSATARALNVNLRTVQRWLSEGDVPPGVIDELTEMLAEKQRRDKALAPYRDALKRAKKAFDAGVEEDSDG